MEDTYITKAIILSRQPFREHDSKTVVYSPVWGKMELIARGVKKAESKLAGHLEPISFVNLMVVRGRQFNYIGGAVSENCYLAIKSDLEKIKFSGQAINDFNNLIKEGEGDENVFNLLLDFLNILNKNIEVNYQLFYNFFIFKLLAALGYGPELYNCLICSKKIKPNNNKFDLARGGLICSPCKSQSGKELLTISDDCIKVLRLASQTDLAGLARIKLDNILNKEINNLVWSFLNYCHN